MFRHSVAELAPKKKEIIKSVRFKTSYIEGKLLKWQDFLNKSFKKSIPINGMELANFK